MGCNTSKETSQPVENEQENEKNIKNEENINHTEKTISKNDKEEPITESTEEEDKAAIRIQAAFRGHKARASMKQGDTAASGTAGTATAKKDVKVEQNKVTDQKEEDPSKEQLEAEFRADDKELCDAATRIQASFRGHMARKAAPPKDEKEIEELAKKVAEELDIDLTDPELNKAATKIQASFRGHKVRKETDGDN